MFCDCGSSCISSVQINEPAQDKTYKKTCVASKDSDQPVYPPSMARLLVYPSFEPVEGTGDRQRLIRLR